MTDERRTIRRTDLPAEFTPESLRTLPIGTLRRLRDPHNGILTAGEQASFDAALHQVMSAAAGRVWGQLEGGDWQRVWRDSRAAGRRDGPRPLRPEEQNLSRLARRVEQQLSLAESLAPDVDWSFIAPDVERDETGPEKVPEPAQGTVDGALSASDVQTIPDLESQLTDQLQLVQVVTEIAEMGRRTYALEQQRELSNTRTVFFGFVVSVAVIAAGWAPIVSAGWTDRVWIGVLTLVTCLAAGLVYILVRRWQKAHPPETDEVQSS